MPHLVASARTAALGVIAAAALAASACSSAPHHQVVTAPSSPPSSVEVTTPAVTTLVTTPPATTPPTAITAAMAAAPTGVGTVSLNVVDSSRATVSHGRTLSPVRRLPTIVRYPAVGVANGAEVDGAKAAAGPWPLVVFAEGYNGTPATYAHLLHAWAAAGFVVAAPAFPLETAGGPLDENDLDNEPGDLSVVISAVLNQSAGTGGPLAHLVDGAHIAVTGHSDGGEAVLALAYTPGDGRVGPVIAMAAQGIIGGPHPDARHPLLVVQGTRDTIIPPARGDAVYAAAGRPRFELHLLGGDHLPPVAYDTPWRPIVEQVGIDFLRRYLGATVPMAVLTGDANRAGLSSLTSDP